MIAINEILAAYNCIKGVVEKTPLQKSEILSERYSANIYLKREDQQMVRSYKIRGAYYKIASLSDEDRHKGWFVQVQVIMPRVLLMLVTTLI